jgi:hypothetical protein
MQPTEKSVAYWWLELEGAEGRREIGFSASDEVLRFAPIAENRGLFVGEELAPRHLAEHLAAEEFEKAWGRALKTGPTSVGNVPPNKRMQLTAL